MSREHSPSEQALTDSVECLANGSLALLALERDNAQCIGELALSMLELRETVRMQNTYIVQLQRLYQTQAKQIATLQNAVFKAASN